MTTTLGLREPEYNALPGLRSSHVKTVAQRSVAHYLHQVKSYETEGRSIDKKFDGKRVGSIAHIAILEPATLGDRTLELPEYNGSTKEGKPIHEKMKRFRDDPAHMPEVEVVAPKHEFDVAEEVSASAWRHPRVPWVLDDGNPEVTVQWEGGKARFDWVNERRDLICDVKTSRDPVDPATFGRTVLKLGYHISAAWYLRGAAAEYGRPFRFVIIAIESAPPYSCAVYRMGDDWLALGDAVIEHGLERLRLWEETDGYPDTAPTYYDEGVMQIPMPPWAKVKG